MIQQQNNYENLSREELIALLIESNQSFELYKNKYLHLEDKIALLVRQMFGSKSERTKSHSNNVLITNSLFDLEPEAATQEEPEVQKISSYSRKKRKDKNHNGREPFPDHLPVQETILEPQDKQDTDKELPAEITKWLEMSEPLMWVQCIIRKKYLDIVTGKIKLAELPARPVEKSSFGTSVITNLAVAKYVDHFPIYRFVEKIKRDHQVNISRSSLGESLHQHLRLLNPLYETHVKNILSAQYLQVDETTIKVQDEEVKGKCHLGFFYGCRNPVDNTVFFSYQHTRSQLNTRLHLNEFKGKLQSDGHMVYDQFDDDPQIEHFGCWAHARRYFHRAQESDPERSNKIMRLIQILYEIEDQCREEKLSHQYRQKLRLEKSQKTLDQIKQLLDQYSLQRILPDSRMGKAIAYTLKRWSNLIRFIHHGEVEIDNNLTENSIRPIALGRKNYLFAGSPEAAQTSAMMYSFFGTCKLHNIDPYEWLKDILDRIASHPINQISDLLPQNWAISRIIPNS